VKEDEESNTLQTVNGRLPKLTSLAGFVLLITNESYQTTFCEVEADLFPLFRDQRLSVASRSNRP